MTHRLTILVPGPHDDDPFELKYYKERGKKRSNLTKTIYRIYLSYR